MPRALGNAVLAAKAWGADLVVVETPGIGQGDAAIVPHVDIPIYVMTPEFGASTQLEKIDMLDHARIVADPAGEMAEAFQVKRLGGLIFQKRVTYVIDAAGVIRGIFHHEFAIDSHVEDVRRCLASLRPTA